MPRTGRYVNKEEAEIVKQAIANLEALCDPETNAIPTESLKAEVKRIAPFDADKAQQRNADRIVKEQERPGKTESLGQKWFPGWDPVPYEPNQLIPDGEGQTVERDKATPPFVNARLIRQVKNAEKVNAALNRETAECDAYMEWAVDEDAIGRPANQITFGNFLREKGYWSDEPAEDETEDDDDEEE